METPAASKHFSNHPIPGSHEKKGFQTAARSNLYPRYWILQFFYSCYCPLHLLCFKVLMLFVNKKWSAPLFPKSESHLYNVPNVLGTTHACWERYLQAWSQFIVCALGLDNHKSSDTVLGWVMVQPMRIKIASSASASHSNLDFIASKSRWLWRDFFPPLYVGTFFPPSWQSESCAAMCL